MIVESAPWLLFGLLIAGIIHTFLPKGFIEKRLKESGFGSVLKATIYGIPLPLCSCSVIPVAVSLRKGGASRGATASFFVSTPEIGVDSFILSYVLLGPVIAFVRIIAVFISAMGAGLAIDKFVQDPDTKVENEVDPPSGHCCQGKSNLMGQDVPQWDKKGISYHLKKVLGFSYSEMVDDLSVVLTLGFVASGLIAALFPENYFSGLISSPFLSMFLMLFISLPFYVCATSSTPLVAALFAKGLSPGAGLIFLLAGPATNISTMLAIRKELGSKSLVIYILIISSVALLFGALTNLFFSASTHLSATTLQEKLSSHSHDSNIFAVIFLILLLTSLGRKLLQFATKTHKTHKI